MSVFLVLLFNGIWLMVTMLRDSNLILILCAAVISVPIMGIVLRYLHTFTAHVAPTPIAPPQCTIAISNHREDLLNEDCSICLEKFTLEDKVATLQCSHVFHVACMHSWLEQNSGLFCPFKCANFQHSDLDSHA